MQIGFGGLQADLRVFIILLADGVYFRQLRVAPGRGLSRFDGGAGLGGGGLHLGKGGLVRRRINLIQRLAGLDLGPFDEQALLHNAADLRTDLRNHKCLGATGQLGGQCLTLRLHSEHRNLGFFGNGRGITGRASAQHNENQQRHNNSGGYQGFGKQFDRHGGLYKTVG